MTDRIKKLLMSFAALAALAAGGAAYAGAQGSPTATSTATPAATGESETGTADDPADKSEGSEQAGEHGDGDGEGKDSVTGDTAAKAKAAALAEVPGGKVGDISAEQSDASKGTDKPEAGDTPDPAYESKIAYDVEVNKTDGTQVTVHLDKGYQVLGVTTEKPDGNDGENAND